MGAGPATKQGVGLTDPRKPEDSRPSLGPAIISGGCAVLVALITGVFNWINRPPADPETKPPTLAVEHAPQEPSPVRTASLDTPPIRTAPRPTEPQYGLNFAAFQAVVKDLTRSDEDRQQVVDRVQGHVVIWEGCVQKIVLPETAP